MPNHEEVATSPHAAGPGAAGRTFGPGELLARRYRVVRFIARGGMGEVYEAEDQHLGVRVALKTIRPEMGLDARTLERFKREVLLARQVTHPNVCRIFDIGVHEEEGAAPLAFLTMELLEGETLAERLHRGGPMRPEILLPLVRQVVAGLQAAHDAGVVHRDLKTANLMLLPLSGGSERVVITDFGLARHVEATGDHASTVVAMVGTPAYMAPEQVEGSVAGPAADVYALGVVLYEVLTGERPFRAESPLHEALRRLHQTPPSPSSKVPDLPPAWDQAVMRCLARRPEDRFQRVDDLLAALEAPVTPPPRGRHWPVRVAVAGALVGVLAAVLVWQLNRHRTVTSGRQAAPARVARRCVAVLGFKNLKGRLQEEWVGTALGEMLASELAAGERLRLLPGESAARLKSDLGIPEGEALAPETLRRIRKNADVDVVLLGSYLAGDPGGNVWLDLHIQDALTGDEMNPLSATGSVDHLAELASSAGATVRTRLGVGEATAEVAAAARAEFPANPEAARLYSEGVAKLWVFECIASRDLLLKAVAIEPDHPMIHDALGRAYSCMGQTALALAEARRAFETSAGLPREQRLAIEASSRSANHESGRAVEILKALHTFFPDNLEHGIRLAEALTQLGKPAEAYGVLAELRRLPAPLGDDPQIDYSEALAAQTAADFERGLEAARRAVTGAEQRGARLFVAQALAGEGSALIRLGRPSEAEGPLNRAAATFAAIGDRFREANALNTLGVLHYERGELRLFGAACERSLAACRVVENRGCAAFPLQNLLLIALWEGNLTRAEALCRDGRAAAEATGSERVMVFVTLDEAILRTFQGRLREARETANRALELAHRTGDRVFGPNTEWALGEIDLAEGNVAAARRHCQAASDGFEAVGIRFGEIVALAALGRCRLAGDDLDGAATATSAAARLGEEIGNRLWGARALAARGEVELARGDAAAAERSARAGLAMLGEEPAVWVEAQVELALARVLLGQGRLDAAGEASAKALRTAAATHVPQLQLEARLCSAEVDLAREHAEKAAARLPEVVSEAHGLGLVTLELEGRVALSRAQVALGRTAEGRAALEAVVSAAKAKGLLRVARLASLH